MDNKKFDVIFKRLLELSEKNQLKWKTTANPEKFLLVLKESSITIENGFNADYGTIFGIEFRNEKGEVVEAQAIMEEDNYHKSAEHLFNLARGNALNSDKTIDRILEQLNPDSLAA